MLLDVLLKNYMTHYPQYARLELTNIYRTGQKEMTFDQAQSMPALQEALGILYIVSRNYAAAATSFCRALEMDPKITRSGTNLVPPWPVPILAMKLYLHTMIPSFSTKACTSMAQHGNFTFQFEKS
jgi:hypothetical protein